GAPYEVVDAKSWVIAGAGLKNGDKFGAASPRRRRPGGASGHETDTRTPSTPAGAILIARGLNPDDGGADFSAGSIRHPGSVVVDDALSIVTGNVLNRFLNEPTV
ncbi:MAG: carboxypeptidase regulatory-like domain-containing protein, partial [Planctomycetia bacterium]